VIKTQERCGSARNHEECGYLNSWNIQQECVVCGTVYVTEKERKAQGLDSEALGTQSGSRQEEIPTSRVPVGRLNAITKGKEKASESPAVTPVRSLGDWVIRNNS
jgi:hypothetical protein